VLDEQTQKQLNQKFQEIRPQLKQRFSGVTDDDLAHGQSDPAAMIKMISQKTGQAESEVEQEIRSLVSQGGGRSGSARA
jgi:hypothetical protein